MAAIPEIKYNRMASYDLEAIIADWKALAERYYGIDAEQYARFTRLYSALEPASPTKPYQTICRSAQ